MKAYLIIICAVLFYSCERKEQAAIKPVRKTYEETQAQLEQETIRRKKIKSIIQEVYVKSDTGDFKGQDVGFEKRFFDLTGRLIYRYYIRDPYTYKLDPEEVTLKYYYKNGKLDSYSQWAYYSENIDSTVYKYNIDGQDSLIQNFNCYYHSDTTLVDDTIFSYNEKSLLTEKTSRSWHGNKEKPFFTVSSVTKYEYDSLNNLTREISSSLARNKNNEDEEMYKNSRVFKYNEKGQLIERTTFVHKIFFMSPAEFKSRYGKDSVTEKIQFAYDSLGKRTKELFYNCGNCTNPSITNSCYHYNRDGNLITLWEDTLMSIKYDEKNNISEIISGNKNTSTQHLFKYRYTYF